MSLSARGYVKVMEECGELVQIVAKRVAYWGTNDHPDGKSINKRIEQEMADVLAAIQVTMELNSELDHAYISRRQAQKAATFRKWSREPDMRAISGTPLPPPNAELMWSDTPPRPIHPATPPLLAQFFAQAQADYDALPEDQKNPPPNTDFPPVKTTSKTTSKPHKTKKGKKK